MKFRKSLLSALLILTVLFSAMPVTAAAQSDFPDMPADTYWSAAALQNAVANGLLKGSPDGRLLPKANLTRAEMMTMMVRAFGGTVKGDLSAFIDVPATAWYADAMAVAYQMGIVKGTGKLMKPNAPITRQEVFTIVARAMKLKPAEAIDKTFSDVGDIASWAEGETYALVNAGYVEGSDGKLNPQGLITREEFAKIFDNIVKQYIITAGTYTTTSAGNVMIQVPGVTLSNLTVSGDLIIGDGVGDGEVILDNVVISGRLVIRGGGINSIIIRGKSSVANVIVARTDGEVSVKVQGDEADVEVIYVDDGSDDVFVEGTVGTLEVAAPNVTVTTVGATISNLNVAAPNAAVVVDAKSKVTNVQVQTEAANAAVTVSGTVANITTASDNTAIEVSGTVTNVTTSSSNTTVTGTGTVTKVVAASGANNVAVQTPNTKITAETGSSNVTGGGGKVIEEGSTGTNNNTGTDASVDTGSPSVVDPVGPPPASSTKTLSMQVGIAGYTLTFANYSYNVNDDAFDVLNGFMSNASNTNLSINTLANAIVKAQAKGLIDAGGKLIPLTVGSTTIGWNTILTNLYAKYQETGAALFDATNQSYVDLIQAINPANLFTISGDDVTLKYTGASYSATNAADFYFTNLTAIVGKMATVLESAPINSALTDAAFYNALGTKLSQLINDIQAGATDAAKCAEAIAAIRGGQGSMSNLISKIGRSSISGTFTVAEALAYFADSFPDGISVFDFINALDARAPVHSFDLVITINADYTAP